MTQFTRHERMLVQRTLNEETRANIRVDGAIGPRTNDAIQKYRELKGLTPGGLDDDLWNTMEPYISSRFMQIEDLVKACQTVGIKPSMGLAIWDKESAGSGFLDDKRCRILYERHIFYKLVANKHGRRQAEVWRSKYPNICHPVWDHKAYMGGRREYERLEDARQLDAEIALMSASWGLFQLMGFNYRFYGAPDVQTMVQAYQQSEHHHLRGFIGFIIKQPALKKAMAEYDYHTVGLIYNGKGYRSHGYHIDLEQRRLKYASFD